MDYSHLFYPQRPYNSFWLIQFLPIQALPPSWQIFSIFIPIKALWFIVNIIPKKDGKHEQCWPLVKNQQFLPDLHETCSKWIPPEVSNLTNFHEDWVKTGNFYYWPTLHKVAILYGTLSLCCFGGFPPFIRPLFYVETHGGVSPFYVEPTRGFLPSNQTQ